MATVNFFVIKQLFRKLFCSLFALHFLCSALLQAHYLSVDTVNFGHKKTQPKLGRCVGYLSVVMYWLKDLYKKPPDGGFHN